MDVVFAREQLDLNVGVALVEILQDLRQQADGKAREAAETQRTGLHAVQLGHGKVQILVILNDLADRGQQHHAVRRDLNAGMVAREKLDLPVLLQIGDHFAYGGLRIAQLVRGLCDAAGFHGAQIGNVFADAHNATSQSQS